MKISCLDSTEYTFTIQKIQKYRRVAVFLMVFVEAEHVTDFLFCLTDFAHRKNKHFYPKISHDIHFMRKSDFSPFEWYAF